MTAAGRMRKAKIPRVRIAALKAEGQRANERRMSDPRLHSKPRHERRRMCSRAERQRPRTIERGTQARPMRARADTFLLACPASRSVQCDIDTRPSALGPPFTGHFRVLLDMPRGLQPLHPGTKALKASAAAASASSSLEASRANLNIRTNVYQTSGDQKSSRQISEREAQNVGVDTLTKKPQGQSQDGDEEMPRASGSALEPISYSCDTCGADCTEVRYHSIRRLGGSAAAEEERDNTYDVCPACYADGRFPSALFSGDFLRIDSAAAYRSAAGLAGEQPWTDAETLLLLEGMEMFADDWDRISEHVASRSREECIAHFLQLPIEDEYLLAETGAGAAGAGMMSRSERLPFSQPDHPVLSVVAFLASVVDPEIAAKAASESVQSLTEQLKLKAAQANGDKEAGDAESADKQKDKDADMAVDGAADSPGSKTKADPLHRSANIALSSAAAKAHLLASQTSSELVSQVHSLVSLSVRKLDLKLSTLSALEGALDNERRQLEQSRALLAQERMGISKQLDAVAELSRKAAAGEAVPTDMVEAVRAMGRDQQAGFRSGMGPRVTQLQQGQAAPANGHLNGTNASFTALD